MPHIHFMTCHNQVHVDKALNNTKHGLLTLRAHVQHLSVSAVFNQRMLNRTIVIKIVFQHLLLRHVEIVINSNIEFIINFAI